MIYYEKISTSLNNNELINVYISSDGSFLEIYPDNSTIGWKRLLSGYYIKLSQGWVPGEVVHHCRQSPMQMKVVDLSSCEQLVQRLHGCNVRKMISEQRKSGKGIPSSSAGQRSYPQNSKPHLKDFQARFGQRTATKPKPIALVHPSSSQHSQTQ